LATCEGPRILISCGEPSGDLYAAEILRRLRSRIADLTAFGVGGDRLAEERADLAAHIRDLAVVGILEVVRHLPRIHRVFRTLVAELDRRRPDVAVLVDYPDFNLRLARELKKRGIPVIYYVSPQVWAWKRGRIKTIRATVAKMLVIFPFEEPLYRAEGVPVTYVGHPLVDLVRPAGDSAAFLRRLGLDPGHPVIALLPGSRRPEVANNLPVIGEAVRRLHRERPDLQFLLAAAPLLDAEALLAPFHGVPVSSVRDQTYAAVGAADLAIVASGTATVETALLGTPMVVVYRVSPLTYALGSRFVRVPHYAMINIIAEREVVPELMQGDFTPDRVAAETLALLNDPDRRSKMLSDLADVRRRLGRGGASDRAADAVAEALAARRGDPAPPGGPDLDFRARIPAH
jgi:lipid-A-disaccharide synthase